MKSKYPVSMPVLIVLLLLAGCATTQELTSNVKSKVASITSNVDPAWVNQVPVEKREGFAKAEYELSVASERLKLAELRTERASAQKKYVDYEEDMAANYRKEAALDYDIVKMEAVIKSGLGKSKEDNARTKADLQSKKLKVQADRISIQADLDNAKGKIENLSSEIIKMDDAIKAMKYGGDKTAPLDKK